jgi:hypothetical protein
MTELHKMQSMMKALVDAQAPKVSRAQLAKRHGVTTRTLSNWQNEIGYPPPGPDGKWRLSDVLAWEASKTHAKGPSNASKAHR